MTIERGGHKLRLTVRFNYSGQAEFLESATAPVLYFRSMLADKGAIERAKAMLAGLSFRDGGGTAVSMYDGKFPAGWTKEFAGTRIKVPYPAQIESLQTDPKEDGVGSTVRYAVYQSGGESSWAVAERLAETQESIVDLAKRPLPRVSDVFPKPRIASADLVEWNGQKLLRQRGEYDSGEFTREWMSLTARDNFWRLHTVILRKKKGAPWPSVPFPIDAPGTPVVEGAWKKPPGNYVRTVDLGSGARFTYSVWGAGEPAADGETLTLVSEKYQATTLRFGKSAEAATEELDMTGRFDSKLVERLKLKAFDYQWKREGASWWLAHRKITKGERGEDLVLRAEFVGTEQGGKRFLLTMVGIDNDSQRQAMAEAVVSCKGADGTPLFRTHPGGKAGTEYILPFHKRRHTLDTPTPLEAVALGEGHLLLGGFYLPDEARAVLSVQMDFTGGVPHEQRVFESRLRGQKMGGAKKVEFGNGGKKVAGWRREFKNPGGTPVYLTTFFVGGGAYVHVMQTKGKPESWRESLSLGGG